MKTGYRLIMVVAGVFAGFLAAGNTTAAEDFKACHDDVQKFCADVKPGEGRIAQCLKQHEADLSAACQESRQQVREHLVNMHEACKADRAKYCHDTKPGEGRLYACLQKHSSELSAACQDAMKRPNKP